MTMFVYSMYLAGAGGVTNYNAGLGLALFYGGFIQLLAGIFEMIRGDIFHGTVFSSFGNDLLYLSCEYLMAKRSIAHDNFYLLGGYWICFGFIHFDATGIISSYKDNPEMLSNSLGIFLTGWTICK